MRAIALIQGSHQRRRRLRVSLGHAAILLLMLSTLFLAPSAYGASFTVTTVNDSGPGSLRQAILDANMTAGSVTIGFNIPGTGVHTIALLSVLPTITVPVTIDGYTQPGAQPNTLAHGNSAKLLIELNGRGDAGFYLAYGLKISSGNSTVRGLVINRFGYDSASTGEFYPGIVLENGGGNTIAGNFIGLDALGTANLGNGGDGVQINNSASNIIGGSAPAARNVISGNGNAGIWINGRTASSNIVQGDYIGTNASGTAAIGNLHGVVIGDGSNNTIGGTTSGAGDLISGNHTMGVWITGTSAKGNLVQGNIIGADASGTIGIGNYYGVQLLSASSNQIGGSVAGARNIISGNALDGVSLIYGGQGLTTGSTIQGNYIGTDVTGNSALPNAGAGIMLFGASGSVIGGTMAGAGNVISGNLRDGIWINGQANTNTLIQGNIVGLNSARSDDIGNVRNGVHIDNASNTSIGGQSASAGNIIAYNDANGVDVTDTTYSAVGNLIASNSIFMNDGSGIEISLKRQETPVLSYTSILSGSLFIQGSVASSPGMTITLQFFKNQVCDPSGAGEGESLIDTTTVIADSNGVAQIDYSTTRQFPFGRYITATATDTANNTSKFSNCVMAVAPFLGNIPLIRR